MPDIPSRFDSLLRELREKGYHIAPQRLAILKILAESRGHPGAEEIHALVKKGFPTTTIATVYKTLAVPKSTGEVLELEFSGDYKWGRQAELLAQFVWLTGAGPGFR
jgi:Fur family peroxide stress response transcriptional regulator